MSRPWPNPPAVVREVEDLNALARRVKNREKKSRKDQLMHAKRQAADVVAAHKLAKAQGKKWADWCEAAGLSRMQANRYERFGRRNVTLRFRALGEDQQWEEWQRIQGNVGQEEDGPEEAERPGTTTYTTTSSPPPGPPRLTEVTVRPGPTIGGEFEVVRTEARYMTARRKEEGEPRQEGGQAGGQAGGGIKSLGVGMAHAAAAVDCLKRIPKDDALRERGFQHVTDWVRHNGGDEAAEVYRQVGPLLDELDEAGRRKEGRVTPAAVRRITTELRRALSLLFPGLAPEEDGEA
jgi:hypothetical protein